MTRLVVVDGGPRKTWNTAQLLAELAAGATEAGAEVQAFRLYDLDYKGCVSCFACKQAGKPLEKCARRDGLAPVLDAVSKCDALAVGSPIYFGDVTGQTRAFFERLLFPYLSYSGPDSQLGRRINTALIYTTNCPEAEYPNVGYTELFRRIRELFEWIIGPCSELFSSETLQFDDYSKYDSGRFDPEQRLERHKTVFPEDLRRARELGTALVK